MCISRLTTFQRFSCAVQTDFMLETILSLAIPYDVFVYWGTNKYRYKKNFIANWIGCCALIATCTLRTLRYACMIVSLRCPDTFRPNRTRFKMKFCKLCLFFRIDFFICVRNKLTPNAHIYFPRNCTQNWSFFVLWPRQMIISFFQIALHLISLTINTVYWTLLTVTCK